MKKGTKRPLNRRIVELAPESMSDGKFTHPDKLDMKRANMITRTIVVRASAERCFELIARQLEETPDWDPTIMWVNPINQKHVRVGSMSRVNFSLDGVREEAMVMIRSFKQNRAILWTSNHSSQLQEQWQLHPEPHGTVVTVTLGYNPTGWIIGRITDKLVFRNKVEKAVSEMMNRLKITAENTEAE
ncbi:SRPBCC family protein [Chloroflexota bacterium]